MKEKAISEKKVAGIISNNPEQNIMQGHFLDDEFCLKFFQIAAPNELVYNLTKNYEIVFNKRKINVELINPTGERYIWNKNFEKENIDVSFCVAIVFERVKEAWDSLSLKDIQINDNIETTYFTKTLKIEIQPIISDDYPFVLRHMQNINANCLYVRDYLGKGLDEQKFVKIFNNQDISVIFEKQLINN